MIGPGGDLRGLLARALAGAGVAPAQRELAWAVLECLEETGMRPSRAVLARRLGRSPVEVFVDLQVLVEAGVLAASIQRGAAATFDVAGAPADRPGVCVRRRRRTAPG